LFWPAFASENFAAPPVSVTASPLIRPVSPRVAIVAASLPS
jgi:hypothetical protein